MIALDNIIRINHESRIPKYLQIVNSIVENIGRNYLIVGEKIPSINEISEEFFLSRDTVEKAYNELKKRKIVSSVKGKGYYVARNVSHTQIKILFLLNKPSYYKLEIYNSFLNSLGDSATVDLNLYNCDPTILTSILRENMGAYDYYVVMPHFKNDKQEHQNENDAVLDVLNELPEDKLIIMDNLLPSLCNNIASVCQDFKSDIYHALEEGSRNLVKYDKLILVYPENVLYPYPQEIREGFKKFCSSYGFDSEVIPTIFPDMEFGSNDAYITIEENDLVNLMRQIKDHGMQLGKDVGVISYNDTPLKELLGITVMSTDFKVMGETAAYMIKKGKSEQVKNVFNYIERGSI
ncbi:GntR family transcriptional regulator [Anditalea andensis]|uniref:Transcriptional regulator n=1 Tax=Anditalea andensis TaxID=1048983 RepID=A0A074KWE6_9BACT|nr:GntR family transcriptional regulator [Anditalea andensis]KEO74306.1 transcriptional regulator [Anditalea andensis]